MRTVIYILVLALSALFMMNIHHSHAGAPPPKTIQTTPEAMQIVAVGYVTEIVKPDQIKLSNGKSYVLDNIRIPVELNQHVEDYLKSALIGKQVGIFVNPLVRETHIDKFGNLIGHVVTDNGAWVQADLVLKGLAWAYSTETSRDLVIPLYRYEDAARKGKLGLWRNPANMVKYDKSIVGTEGSFQVYEGIVKNLHIAEPYIYINFGKDPATDFTILVKLPMTFYVPRGYFETFAHQRIRIRGWVESNSGPMMYLTHPEQIEILDVAFPRAAATCDPAAGGVCPPSAAPPAPAPAPTPAPAP